MSWPDVINQHTEEWFMTYHESSNGGATVASVTREDIEDGIARARRLRAQFFTDAIRVEEY